MRFLPLPHGAVRYVAIATALLLVWLAWGTLKYPGVLWAPGDLSRYHADIAACDDCHQPFQGPIAGKCIACHTERRFAAQSLPAVSEFHQDWIRGRKTCSGCHTEHRGALAQITVGAMINPHGEFVFRATGTDSCSACHDFSAAFSARAHLLDNSTVRHLMEEGKGAHRPGKMATCLTCHTGGRLNLEDNNEDD